MGRSTPEDRKWVRHIFDKLHILLFFVEYIFMNEFRFV